MTQHSNSKTAAPSRNLRKWLAGSTVLSGAAGIATAGPVQIVQTNSELTLNTNTIQPDLTGDGIDDLSDLNFFQTSRSNIPDAGNNSLTRIYFTDFRIGINSGTSATARTNIGGGNFFGKAAFIASRTSTRSATTQPFLRTAFGSTYEASVGSSNSVGSNRADLTGLVPITFQDSRVNNNQLTNGFVEVRATNTSRTTHVIQFLRLIFDDASTSAPQVSPDIPLPDASLNSDPNAALIARIQAKIKRLKRQLRRARQAGNSAKVAKIRKRLKKEQRRLRALR